MSDVLVSFAAETDVGLHRSGNEDAFLVADLTSGKSESGSQMSPILVGERGVLLVVSDGMGGAAAGEVASEMAVTTLRDRLLVAPPEMTIAERLRFAAEESNNRIWDYARTNPEVFGMGATLTGVIIHDGYACVGQVGDSRAYLIRAGQIQQLTKDQSLVQLLVDSGAIQPEQVNAVPQNVIMQALGTQPNVKVVLTGIKLCADDHLLICSDGLSNKLESEDILNLIGSERDLGEISKKMIELANERGGEDNITVILARFEGEALSGCTDEKSLSQSLDALSEGYLHENLQRDGFAEYRTRLDRQETAGLQESVEHGPDPCARLPDSSQSETGDEPNNEEFPFSRRPSRRLSYIPILVMAIVSILMVAAATYFLYDYYLRETREPAPVQDAPTR